MKAPGLQGSGRRLLPWAHWELDVNKFQNFWAGAELCLVCRQRRALNCSFWTVFLHCL